jgi:hypothetical protein
MKFGNKFFIFIGVFILSLFFLNLKWDKYVMTDSNMWGDQAKYVLNGDNREFNFLGAYGHPGGPIIEGTIIVHKLLNVNYSESLLLFVEFIMSFFIASICTLCFILNKDKLWWVAVIPISIFGWMYQYGTPPSLVSTVIITFLCLLTLYIYEKKEKIKYGLLILWAFIAGISVATRTDIGLVSSFFFFLLILNKINWKMALFILLEACMVFVVFDPFMWFMPIQHLKDLIFKVTYHYSEFAPVYLRFFDILSISTTSFISIMLAIFLFFSKKKEESMVLPPRFLWVLITMTMFLYIIFLSAHTQAERYFLPIIFIWETFFPILLFSLVDKMGGRFVPYIKIFIIILLISGNIFITFQNVWACSPSCF